MSSCKLFEDARSYRWLLQAPACASEFLMASVGSCGLLWAPADFRELLLVLVSFCILFLLLKALQACAGFCRLLQTPAGSCRLLQASAGSIILLKAPARFGGILHAYLGSCRLLRIRQC